MNFKRLWMAASLVLAPAGLAQAERNPTPPPSGIVVHLFGPNSIMSDVAPDLPGETPAHPAAGQSAGASATAAAGGSAAADTDSVNTSTDPSWHAILHQMFVVGDPNDPNQPAAGRPGERQNVQQ